MSYQPKHRADTWRDRGATTARRVVVGTATASLVAVPSLAVTAPADAATDRAWNRLAGCESDRRWHVNTGNGYYGGLQFSRSTWRAFGGKRFARRADKASRAEQVVTAERVLGAQGWGAWPACTDRLGYGRREARGEPRHSQRRVRGENHRGHRGHDGDRSDRRRHRPSRSGPREDANKRHHRHARGRRNYTVRSGDTLSRVARRFDVNGGWRRLYRINRQTIGGNPGRLRVGMRLRVPR